MPIGHIVWFDLMTPKPTAAPDFYGPVVGWNAQHFPGYSQWTAPNGIDIGGIQELGADMAAMGVPPHWIGYTQVADVDATVEKAKGLGAQVHVPPTDIPSTGRFAVLGDPMGATFAVYTHVGDQPDKHLDQSGLGHFAWSELQSSDPEGALKFYGELFGWKQTGEPMDMGPEMGKYTMFGLSDDKMFGGLMKLSPQLPVSMWFYYFRVADCDAAFAKARELGATEYFAPMDIPGGGRACMVADPAGAAVGFVWEPDRG